MARKYNRDSRGRFASGGGGGGGGGGTPKARAAVTRSAPKTTTARGRARTAEANARAALRAGGGTRAARSLATAQRARDWYRATGGGTKRSRTKPRAKPASGIRRTGGLRRPGALRANAIRTYQPTTPGGQIAKGLRRIDRAIRGVEGSIKKVKGVKNRADDIMLRIARSSARNIADSSRKDVIGDVARIMMRSEPGSIQRAARDVIRRRAGRAAAAASRGSKPAAKAMAIYDRQLVPVLSGKPVKKAGNAIKPGPRNANPPKKKPRKPRKRKPKG